MSCYIRACEQSLKFVVAHDSVFRYFLPVMRLPSGVARDMMTPTDLLRTPELPLAEKVIASYSVKANAME